MCSRMISDQDKPRVLVLMAAYNGIKWIEEQVDSVLNQVNVDVRLCISVDKSSDGTEQWVDELCKKDSRVFALPHGSRFGGAASNFFRLLQSVELYHYDGISLADQDDIWFKEKLSRAFKILNEKGCDGYSSNVIAFWGDGRRKLIKKAQPQRKFDYLFEAAGPGCTYLLSNRLATSVQAFCRERADSLTDIMLHDWFIYALARSAGYRWYIDAEPSLLYRQHGGNQVGANVGFKAVKSRIAIFRSGVWLRQGKLIESLIESREEADGLRRISLTRCGLLKMAAKSFLSRRSRLDQCLFFMLCLSLALSREKL